MQTARWFHLNTSKPKPLELRYKASCLSTRACTEHEGFIIKYAHDCYGDHCSFSEREINAEIDLWKVLTPEERVYFCPLVWYSKSRYVVQPLIDMDLVSESPDDEERVFEEVEHLVNKYQLYDLDVGNNLYCVEGRPLIFDWGQNMFNPQPEFSSPRGSDKYKESTWF